MLPLSQSLKANYAENNGLNTAYHAWNKAYREGTTKKTIFVYIDFTQPSTEKRFFVYDGITHQLLYSTWVSHGIGSGRGTIPTTFSNTSGSKATSLGVQITGEYYRGKHGIVLRMKGLERWNSNVYSRYIEIHGANYIGNGLTGTSWGCYAVPEQDINRILKLVGPGVILVAYYPDSDWLQHSEYIKG